MIKFIAIFLPAALMVIWRHWLFNAEYELKSLTAEYIVDMLLVNEIAIFVAWVWGGFCSIGIIEKNIINSNTYALKYILLASAVSIGISSAGKFISAIRPDECNKSKKYRAYFLILVICVFIEICLFNGKSLKYMDSNTYKNKKYAMSDFGICGFDVSDRALKYKGNGEASITISGIKTCIGTIFIDVKSDKKKILSYDIYYTDSANQYLYRKIKRETVSGIENSKYTVCHFNGKSEQIKIVFKNLSKGEKLEIRSVSFNRKIPIYFNVVRFLLLFTIITGIYAIRNSNIFSEKVEYLGYRHIRLGIMTVSVFLFLLVAWELYSNSIRRVEVYSTSEDAYTRLTDALLNGRTYIEVKQSEKLATFESLDNPYDISERKAKGIYNYQWDYSYYKGHFYVYFGVIPAVILFVPFKLLTGQYLSTGLAAFIFFAVYIIFLNLLLHQIMTHVLPDVSFGCLYLSMLTVNAASCVLSIITRLKFYELAYASGLALSAMGLYVLCRWLWGKKSRKKLFYGSFCMALAVGCRPTMVLYSFILIPLIVKEWLKDKNRGILGYIYELIPMIVAYIAVAIPLMYYNYVRFDSIAEFGLSYQLTTANFLLEKNQTASIFWCLWLNVFEPFSISAKFPFIRHGSNYTDYTGHFYNAGNVIAMFSLIPLLWCTFIPSAWNKWRMKHGGFATVTLMHTLIIGWAMAILVFWTVGVHQRYVMESLPILATVAVMLYSSFLDERSQNKKTFMTVFAVGAIFSLYASFSLGMIGENQLVYKTHPGFYSWVERMFCFWL